MAELSDKEKLLRLVKQLHKKRKIKKVTDTQLTVEGVSSSLVADTIANISYSGTPSIEVRQSLRNIVNSHQSKDRF